MYRCAEGLCGDLKTWQSPSAHLLMHETLNYGRAEEESLDKDVKFLFKNFCHIDSLISGSK